MHCNAATWAFITSGKSHGSTGIGSPSKQQRVVLRRRNTVVGGKCALLSALLVGLAMIPRMELQNTAYIGLHLSIRGILYPVILPSLANTLNCFTSVEFRFVACRPMILLPVGSRVEYI